jgi:histidine kinase
MPLTSPLNILVRAPLRTQLILSYALVLVIDVVTFALTVYSLSLGTNVHLIRNEAEIRQYTSQLDSGLVQALLAGVGLSFTTGALAAIMITRLIVRPLEQMRVAAGHMTQGHYEVRVPAPGTPELAGIADDMNTLAARLAETEKRRVRLVSDLAHELRTPLTVLRGQIDGLADGLFQPSPSLIASISEEVERLARLTSELSHLSRAEENAYQLRLLDTDLAVLISGVADKLRQEFDARGVALGVVAAGPVRVVADPDRVSQILVNLLSNAREACDSGDRVTVSLNHERGMTAVRVTDTGCGIPPGELELIFERFERRTAPGRQTPHHGSGIGLTIARALARAHGGTLTADSAGPDRGATFTLTLPDQPGRT